jgi:hypothetical protein
MANLTVRCLKPDCFANKCGTMCSILTESIKRKACPFYKTQEQYEADKKTAHDRLEEMGRYDLIDQYELNPKRRNW